MRHISRKRPVQRLTALALCAALMLGQIALASEALGWDLHTSQRALSQGSVLHTGWFWSDTYSDLRTERYVTYEPNAAVVPSVAYGSKVLKKNTLTALSKYLESTGKRVVGGTNGDFYVVATGAPLGMVVTDGILRSSSSYHYAVGFRADGTAFIGQPSLRITAHLPDGDLNIGGGVNKTRTTTAEGGGVTLFTEDFSDTTHNTSPGVDVYLTPLDEGVGTAVEGQELVLSKQLRIGGRVRCQVSFLTEAEKANPIYAGSFVLSASAKEDAALLARLRALQPGDEVSIDVTSADERWSEAKEALGGMFRLLEGGQVGSGLTASVGAQQTARTAIGVKADGTVLFYTLDGKQKGLSVGASCTQIAMRLKELGCVDAIGLDGGGSTTLGATFPDSSSMEIVNSPSDGSARAVTNAIFLTTDLKPTGVPGALDLTPGDAVVLAGSTVYFSARALDTAWYDMGAASGVSYTAAGAGTVSTGGTFIAGAAGDTATVSASMSVGAAGADGAPAPTVTGSATVTVVDTPTSITVKNEATGAAVKSLSVEPGETVSLTASAVWKGLAVGAQDTCYTWTCDGHVGTVSADGTFTAGTEGAKGSLTVSAGERKVTVPVSVAGHIKLFSDLEAGSPFLDTDTAQGTVETSLDKVKTGYQSLRSDYAVGPDGTAWLLADLNISGESHLGLWAYGDGSGNDLVLRTGTADGASAETVLTKLSFTGWRHVLAELPEGAMALTGLGVRGTGSGRIWIDQITTANGPYEDFTAPTVQVKISGGKLTATVKDDFDKSIPASAVTATWDGADLAGSWNGSTFTAALPSGGGAHRATVTARDVSGNLARSSVTTGESGGPYFTDTAGHWAGAYADYLYEQGVSKGTGTGAFQPDAQITRGEFFTMAARWMGLDLSKYAGVELPFADAGSIPDWALPALRAMYAEGIVTGSLEGGKLYAQPGATISRAEAMTILGRTQERGGAEADLSAFPDAAQVPAWALSYVRGLVGQGAIGGYADGTLQPGAPMTRGQVAKVLWSLR